MGSFITTLFERLEKLFGNSRIGTLASIVTIVALILAFVILANAITGYLFYWDMGKQVTLLQDLQELSEKNIEQNPELKPIYEEITAELKDHERASLSKFITVHPTSKDSLFVKIWKFLSAGWLSILGVISGVEGFRKKTPNWKAASIVLIVFGGILGYLGISIPTLWYPIVNYISYILFQITAVYWLMRLFPTTKTKTQVQPIG